MKHLLKFTLILFYCTAIIGCGDIDGTPQASCIAPPEGIISEQHFNITLPKVITILDEQGYGVEWETPKAYVLHNAVKDSTITIDITQNNAFVSWVGLSSEPSGLTIKFESSEVYISIDEFERPKPVTFVLGGAYPIGLTRQIDQEVILAKIWADDLQDCNDVITSFGD